MHLSSALRTLITRGCMSEQPIKQKIYLDLEPHFVYDYIFFSAHLRFIQSQENSYKQYRMEQKAKAMCLVNLFETYQKSLEDLAAVMLAFSRRYNPDPACSYQSDFDTDHTPLVYTLIHYHPGEANLKKLLQTFSSDADMVNRLGIRNIENINITLLYPDINFQKFYRFFVGSLRDLSTDQEKRLKMFNKIKHGGVIAGDGKLFANNLPHSPAAVYADPKSFPDDDHPLIMHSFKYAEEEFDLMKGGIMRVMVMVKTMLSAYLCREYPDILVTKRFKSPLEILEKIEMKKLLSLWGGY